ncbi:hypothetical protein CesoFtcFv8_010918 [Champsocephalus esox]|uniref:Uncharacterized protein n=1 Tax=Champsocephalus esox TaxID=159716 RepID=A0AAN8GZX6_9TELE|nr:hypothetical protein CesoFtcFv8_010918 [Champsocephalus esox]
MLCPDRSRLLHQFVIKITLNSSSPPPLATSSHFLVGVIRSPRYPLQPARSPRSETPARHTPVCPEKRSRSLTPPPAPQRLDFNRGTASQKVDKAIARSRRSSDT